MNSYHRLFDHLGRPVAPLRLEIRSHRRVSAGHLVLRTFGLAVCVVCLFILTWGRGL